MVVGIMINIHLSFKKNLLLHYGGFSRKKHEASRCILKKTEGAMNSVGEIQLLPEQMRVIHNSERSQEPHLNLRVVLSFSEK